VGCSAFILLCINPYFITEVGFQLSYLAVMGIVSLHQKFYDILSFKNKIMDSIWSISCVSVAAQLVTFPLGLLYFHQFPNYFLFSNLIVIPLSTVILYSGLLLIVVAKIPILGALVAKVLNVLIWLLKYIVTLFENLPFAIIEGISISTFETFIIYGILITLFLYWLQSKIVHLYLAATLSILLCSLQIIEKYEEANQNKMVVYAINKHGAIDFIAGKKNMLLVDSILLKDKDKMKFHITPNWIHLGLYQRPQATDSSLAKAKGHYIIFKNKVILNTSSSSIDFKTLHYVPQVVILGQINLSKFSALFKLFPKASFICDGTISPNLYRYLKKKNEPINMQSVLLDGAITIEV